MPKCLKPVYYLQGDPRWKSEIYKSPDQSYQTISGAGCGITCSAMVIATLIPDSKCTPVETAKWSMDHNMKTSKGTKHEYFVPQFKIFDIPCKWMNQTDTSEMNSDSRSKLFEEVKKILRTGEYFVIACMRPGNWTSSGHYILPYYMDDKYVYINDPASTRDNRIKNTIQLFLSEVKYFWAIPHTGNFKDYTGDEWNFAFTNDSMSDDSDYAYSTVTGYHIKLNDETNNGQGNSDLASYVNRINDSNSSPRSVPITAITIHSARSTGTLKDIGKMMKSSTTSYNYAIDREGQIGLFIDEAYASNATGDSDNDERSVNIACLNTKVSDCSISKACKESLIDLCEDICRRRYITQLVLNEKKPEEGTLTLHRQFISNKEKKKECPGPALEKDIKDVIKKVNERLNTENRRRLTVTSFQADSNSAALRAQSTVSLGAVSPYVARLSHDVLGVNYQGLVNMGVVGVLFHGGVRFDTNHKVRPNLTDIHFVDQMKEFQKSKVNLPFGIDYWSRAISVEEAKQECEWFYYILAKYPPKLGAWIVCRFSTNIKKSVAQDIIATYYEYFVKWGFKSKCGIIADKEHAKLIGWPAQAGYMPLWLEGEMDEDIAPKEEVLTPSYFKLDDLTNKGYNANDEADVDEAKLGAADLKSQFNISGGTISSGGSSGQYDVPQNVKGVAKVGDEGDIPEPIPSTELSTQEANEGKTRASMAGKYRTVVAYEWGSPSACYNYPNISHSGWPYLAAKAVDSANGNVKIDKDNGIAYMLIGGVKRWGAAFAEGVVGKQGDGVCVDLTFNDGTIIPFVTLDTKNRGDAGSTDWGHKGGTEVTEIFMSTKHVAGYQYLGGKSGSYPVHYKIVGRISQKDLYS